MVEVSDVREIIKTPLPDGVITSFIDAVNEKMGMCVNGNYSEETADLIITNMVAYMLTVSAGQNEVSSTRAPNGASVTFNVGSAEKGIASNPYGRIVQMLDNHGCYRAMIIKRVFLKAIGPDQSSKCRRC